MGDWNFIALRIPPLFQSPLLLGDLMGKVKAMYTEMEERNNWKEADEYYESQKESMKKKVDTNREITPKEVKRAYAAAMAIGEAENILITRHNPMSDATNEQRVLYTIIKAYQDIGDGWYDTAKQRLNFAVESIPKLTDRAWANKR